MTAGIITMHKVPNFGSHLQAYALQEFLQSNEIDSQLIDYQYPNEFHIKGNPEFEKRESIKNNVIKILLFPYYSFLILLQKKQIRLFQHFERNYFNLSQKYKNQNELKSANLSYDFYITGSDQVWNPRFARGDSIYMCDFGSKKATRISFGASVAMNEIPEKYKEIYIQNLAKYKAIGIRDSSSKETLESLLNKKIEVVCDPVFLLDSKKWSEISESSKIKLPQNYVLVFILTYAFNPYPQILTLIRQIKKTTNLPIVFVNQSLKLTYEIKPKKNIYTLSVNDFLHLIKNASFVITTSFHVTAFSLIFKRQFISVVNDTKQDSRINDLLDSVDCNNYFFLEDCTKEQQIPKIDYESINSCINNYIDNSKEYLIKNLFKGGTLKE